jgi:DNA-binding HxlR family transcriptional regulator
LGTHQKVRPSATTVAGITHPKLRLRLSTCSKDDGKLVIIYQLFGCERAAAPIMRFSELERAIPNVSQKMLIQQLRCLERDGIVQRTIHPQVPPKVEYQLTSLGEALRPTLRALLDWADLRKRQITHASKG